MPIYKMDGKKDGLQKYRVRINYVAQNGKSKQIDRVAYGLEEAKELERQLQKEIKDFTPAEKLTVQGLYDEYIKMKKHEVRETSLDKTKRILTNHVLGFLGKYNLDKLTVSLLQKWKMYISEQNLSIVTRQNIYGEFRAMLNYAVRSEYLQSNPLLKVGNFKEVYFKTEQDKIHYYTKEEFIKYITFAKNTAQTTDDWNYYTFFNVAYFTGMRKGEINALKWSDIDGNTINVRRSIAQKLQGGDRETPPKNKSSYRSLQIPQPLKIVLDEQKERQKQYKNFSEDFRVCGGEKCLRDSSLDKRNIKYAEGAELHHIRIHDFRHSHASLLANEGINIQEVARRLGHSDVNMTWNTYSHLYPREEERALKVLNEIKF